MKNVKALAFWANACNAKTRFEIWLLLSIFRGFLEDKIVSLGPIDFYLGFPLNIKVNGGQNKFEVHISKNIARIANCQLKIGQDKIYNYVEQTCRHTDARAHSNHLCKLCTNFTCRSWSLAHWNHYYYNYYINCVFTSLDPQVTYIFLLSLTLANLIVSVSVMPLSIVSLISGKWVFGNTICTMNVGNYTMRLILMSISDIVSIWTYLIIWK